MTVVIKAETVNGYDMEIRQEGFANSYTVYMYRDGRTCRKSVQPDLKRARATYNRYRREVEEA